MAPERGRPGAVLDLGGDDALRRRGAWSRRIDRDRPAGGARRRVADPARVEGVGAGKQLRPGLGEEGAVTGGPAIGERVAVGDAEQAGLELHGSCYR